MFKIIKFDIVQIKNEKENIKSKLNNIYEDDLFKKSSKKLDSEGTEYTSYHLKLRLEEAGVMKLKTDIEIRNAEIKKQTLNQIQAYPSWKPSKNWEIILKKEQSRKLRNNQIYIFKCHTIGQLVFWKAKHFIKSVHLK